MYYNEVLSKIKDLILDEIRQDAKDGNIEEIARKCKNICNHSQYWCSSIKYKLAGILTNHYFIYLEGFNYERFARWSASQHNWAIGIIEYFDNPLYLRQEIEKIIRSANNYER